jgi:predicted negative regulator of RcsB-dependent stress response
MANHLDLDEQEQLDQFKHFWKQYGNLITWVLIAVLGAFAAWNAYEYWQRSQATQAAAMFDEVERSIASGDITKVERALARTRNKQVCWLLKRFTKKAIWMPVRKLWLLWLKNHQTLATKP